MMLLTKDGKVVPSRVKVSSSPAYTLDEIEELAKRWRDENKATNDAQWIVSHLLAWLRRREKPTNGTESDNGHTG